MDNNNNQQKKQFPQQQQQKQQPASMPNHPQQNNQQRQQPKHQQQSTPQDPQTGYEKLKAEHRLAIDLKLLHYPYRVIAKKLIAAQYKAAEQTVRGWFSIGGPCKETYEELSKIRREELEEEVKEQKDMIAQGTANALIIINRSLEKAVESDTISTEDYNNARDMLDRGGVPKQTKNDNNNTNRFDSEGMVAMAAVIKSVLDPNAKKEEQPTE